MGFEQESSDELSTAIIATTYLGLTNPRVQTPLMAKAMFFFLYLPIVLDLCFSIASITALSISNAGSFILLDDIKIFFLIYSLLDLFKHPVP